MEQKMILFGKKKAKSRAAQDLLLELHAFKNGNKGSLVTLGIYALSLDLFEIGLKRLVKSGRIMNDGHSRSLWQTVEAIAQIDSSVASELSGIIRKAERAGLFGDIEDSASLGSLLDMNNVLGKAENDNLSSALSDLFDNKRG